MLDWHEQCLSKAFIDEAFNVIHNGNHDINQQDELGMTLLMHLVIKQDVPFVKLLVHSSEATHDSLRQPINLNLMNKNGQDAFSLANASEEDPKRTEIIKLLNVENIRQERIKNRNSRIGYHETSQESYRFILGDLVNNLFSMI